MIPFIEAAEIGTEKVIRDHSSIGIVVTTDGSFGEIPRSNYIDAERRIVSELKDIGKPFIMILNSSHPMLPETERIADNLRDEYDIPVLPMSIEAMNEKDLYNVLKESLYEFPVTEIKVNMPDWIAVLQPDNWLKKIYIDKIKESVIEVDKLRDIDKITNHFGDCEYISRAYISDVDTNTGVVTINLNAKEGLFDEVLKGIKSEYDQIKSALKMVKSTGYGVASPSLNDMKLDSPEVVKQGSRYGIKLKAVAPSIYMFRVDVESTFEPIIGSEMQSKELIDYLMRDSDTDPESLWKSEIFGRSIDQIVKEGIQAKLSLTPENARFKIQQALTKLVNKGSGNLYTLVI